MTKSCVLALLFGPLFNLLATAALAQTPEPRGGTTDFSVGLMVVGSKSYTFEGGASARNDGGTGIGLSLSRNLNDYFAVGVEATFSQFDYRARVAPGSGNAGAAFESNGTLETWGVRFHGTWHLLRGPVTPFVTAGIGAAFLEADLDSAAPGSACWIYPWHGQVCGAAPGNTLTRLGYSAGAGLRIDLPARQGFFRFMVGGEWVDVQEATSKVGWVQVRADFGLMF